MNHKPLWTSAEAAKATGGNSNCNWQAYGVSIDSRKIMPGDLFIALKGDNFDGHNFVAMALDAGAAACVVSEIPKNITKSSAAPARGTNGLLFEWLRKISCKLRMSRAKRRANCNQFAETLPILVVKDTMQALEDLGRFSRKRMTGKIIAVTGSVGKTSCKEMLGMAFAALGKVYFTEGNLNNHFGLPLSLARMAADTDYGIFEIGMNHAGEITPLVKIANPDVAIITTVAAVHLEFFDSVTDIADAKAEIFLSGNKNCIAIINFDNEFYERLKAAATAAGISKIISFGEKLGANYQVVSYREINGASVINLNINGNLIEYTLGICGKHQAINSAAAIAAVAASDGDFKTAANNLAKLEAKSGRGKIYDIIYDNKTVTIIDDCYNASPVSMAAALDNLSNMPLKGRKIAVLGDMFELGQTAKLLHEDLKNKLIANNVDLLFTAGKLMLNLYNAIPQHMRGVNAENSSELGQNIGKYLENGDILLVKGSRGMQMENVIKILEKG